MISSYTVLFAVERVAALVDVGRACTVSPIRSVPPSGFSCPMIMRNSVVLPAPFGADDADDAAARQLEVEVLDQQVVAVALAQVLGLDHDVAEARARAGC